jgi:hypothetical protein
MTRLSRKRFQLANWEKVTRVLPVGHDKLAGRADIDDITEFAFLYML